MSDGTIYPDTGYGTLSVNGTSLFTQAWAITDMSPLLDDAELRGADRLIPHAPGVLARRRRRTVTRMDFPISITGRCDPSGVSWGPTSAHWKAGLIDNCEALRAGLGIGEDAPAGAAGTVTAVWTRPGGLGASSAPVHVLSPLKIKVTLYVAVAVLSLEFPAGLFTTAPTPPPVDEGLVPIDLIDMGVGYGGDYVP